MLQILLYFGVHGCTPSSISEVASSGVCAFAHTVGAGGGGLNRPAIRAVGGRGPSTALGLGRACFILRPCTRLDSRVSHRSGSNAIYQCHGAEIETCGDKFEVSPPIFVDCFAKQLSGYLGTTRLLPPLQVKQSTIDSTFTIDTENYVLIHTENTLLQLPFPTPPNLCRQHAAVVTSP